MAEEKKLSAIEQIQLEAAQMALETAKMDRELKLAELEAKKLEKQEREYHIRDLKGSLAKRDLEEMQLKENRQQQGATFAQQAQIDKHRWNICTHKKGGTAHARDTRCLKTGGNGNQYAVMKHQMINGDIWVRCLRCGRTWAPPVEVNFYFDKNGNQVAPIDGIFNKEAFNAAGIEYHKAEMFETNNTMSGSVQVRFSRFDPVSGKIVDGADVYRESLASTNLR
jgi:hypothetical protein